MRTDYKRRIFTSAAMACVMAATGCEKDPSAKASPPATGIDALIPPVDVVMPTPGKNDKVAVRPNTFGGPTISTCPRCGATAREGNNPLGRDFDYPTAFATLDFPQVKRRCARSFTNRRTGGRLTTATTARSSSRMAWHSAGTYRALDGRGGSDGGQQRFEPLASWPDNANLDKARRLIQPLVDKYYPALSWADAIVLAGNVALEDMGFTTLGFAGRPRRRLGARPRLLGSRGQAPRKPPLRRQRQLLKPLAASVMGLIYVNPEGADGKPTPWHPGSTSARRSAGWG